MTMRSVLLDIDKPKETNQIDIFLISFFNILLDFLNCMKKNNEARDKVSILDLVRKRKKQQKQRFLRDGLKKLTLKSANVIKGFLWHTGLSQAKEEIKRKGI
ncbi:unnamed protein product [Brassica rapa subsp. narinosa]